MCVCAGGRDTSARRSSSALSAAAITFDGAAAGRNNEVIISGLLALGLLFGQFPPRRNHHSKYPSREEITRPTDKWLLQQRKRPQSEANYQRATDKCRLSWREKTTLLPSHFFCIFTYFRAWEKNNTNFVSCLLKVGADAFYASLQLCVGARDGINEVWSGCIRRGIKLINSPNWFCWCSAAAAASLLRVDAAKPQPPTNASNL